MADLFLSSVLDVIVEKLATPLLEKFGNFWDLKDNIEKLRRNLRMVHAVLEDAEEQQANNKAVGIWLSRLKEVAYEAETLLLLVSLSFKNADEVKEMIHALQMVADQGLRLNLRQGSTAHRDWNRSRETSSFVLDREVFGREEDKEKIVKLLLNCETNLFGEASCIPIVGIGGVGKTTLAQLAYNDHNVKQQFDIRVWVFVSHQFDVKNIMRNVIESLTKDKCHYPTLDALYLEVQRLLQKKRYLIVLDDVWTENLNDWDELRPLLAAGIDQSKILITTRSQGVALLTCSPNSVYYLEELSEDACWSVFVRRAFPLRDDAKYPALLPIGEEIVSKCGGVPLAAKTLGSLMRLKRDVREWEIVRDSELWNLDESEDGILAAMRLSYSHLPPHLKRCFSFCSIFPRSYVFKKEKLIHLWMAEGFIHCLPNSVGKEPENVGNDYFNDLQWMSFFQEMRHEENGAVIGYKMHDVIYDLAQSVKGSECILLDGGRQTLTSFKKIRHSSAVCSFTSSAIPEELYEAENHLRTLLLFSGGNVEVVPEILYTHLKCLFVLDLSGSGLRMLDGLIGALLHLKYLDLSYTHIRNLPPEIEMLPSLETLNLLHCYLLMELPDLLKMKRLRHLNNEGCRSLTRMLKNEETYSDYSSQLQTVALFVVGNQNDCMFLNNLQLRLRGILKVTHLENATNALNLCQVARVDSLGLYWGTDDGCPNINPEEEYVGCQFQGKQETSSSGTFQRKAPDPRQAESLIRRFRPADSLQRLVIKGYPGFSFPSMIARGLRELDLINCQFSKNLPSLENVPNLTRLLLRGFGFVKEIDEHFGQLQALEELVLADFHMLRAWLSPDGGRLVFPNLRKLVL